MTEDRNAPDLVRLAEWMQARLGGTWLQAGPLAAHKFGDGQSNPTYLISSADGQRCVLRRKPLGKLLPSAHATDREYRVLAALSDTDVPVPRALAYCDDDTVIGSAFYLMNFADGRHFPDPVLPGLEPAERAVLYGGMVEAIARLHRIDPNAVGLSDYGRPGGYYQRQIERWARQYRATCESGQAEPIPDMERMIETLPGLIPPEDGQVCIAHGDFRIDNLIFHPSEPRVIAILDWELSTLGHPVSDFAYHMMLWRLPRSVYKFGIADVDWATCGIPDEAAYKAAYLRHTGRGELPHWNFAIAFNLYRVTGVLHGIAGRARAGNASNASAGAAAERARTLAHTAWALTQSLLN